LGSKVDFGWGENLKSGEVSLVVAKKSGGELDLENNGVEQDRVKVPMRLKKFGRELAGGNIAARYTQQAAGGDAVR